MLKSASRFLNPLDKPREYLSPAAGLGGPGEG